MEKALLFKQVCELHCMMATPLSQDRYLVSIFSRKPLTTRTAIAAILIKLRLQLTFGSLFELLGLFSSLPLPRFEEATKG